MRMQDVADKTVEIITRYYQNDIQPFLDLCHEDVLWIGPAEGQIIRTRQALVDAFRAEKQALRFAVSDMTVIPVPIGSTKVFNVVAMYTVDTFWPDGSTNRVHQRCGITWSVQGERPSIRLCHLSNAIAYDVQDVIYPVNYSKTFVQATASHLPLAGDMSAEKLSFRGVGKSVFYLNWGQIVYAESAGSHALIHMADQEIETVESLTVIGQKYARFFLRCHESYLVNPDYVQSIARFKITLTNGKVLHVPEKKYTMVKAQLAMRMHGQLPSEDGSLEK